MKDEAIHIYTGLWGDKYPREYAQRFLHGVDRAVGDRPFSITIFDRPPSRETGWWGKIGLFKPGVITTPYAMWIDIDTVFTGPLDDVWDRYTGAGMFAAPWNWAQSGHGGIQSSLMIWDATHDFGIWDRFVKQRANAMRRLHGDQEFLTEMRDDRQLFVTQIDETVMRSYKYHARNGVPPGCRLVTFHGKPDPHECGGWVKEYW